MAESANQVKCVGCGRVYHWRWELAGKTIRCGQCGSLMILPVDPSHRAMLAPPPALPPGQKFQPVQGGFRLAMPAPPQPEVVLDHDGDIPRPPATTPPLTRAAPPPSARTPLPSGQPPSRKATPPTPVPPGPAPRVSAPPPVPDDDEPILLQEEDLIEESAAPTPVSASVAPVGGTPSKAGDEYELNLEGAGPASLPPRQMPHCPSCGTAVKPGAVVCINCGYNLVEGKALQTKVGAAAPPPPRPSKETEDRIAMLAATQQSRKSAAEEDQEYFEKQALIWDWYVPLGMIAGAAAIILLNALLLVDTSMSSSPFATAAAGATAPAAGTGGMGGGAGGGYPFVAPGDKDSAATDDEVTSSDQTPDAGSNSTPDAAGPLFSPSPPTPAPFNIPAAPAASPVATVGPWIIRGLWLLGVTIKIAFMLPFLVFGIFATARLFGTAFGSLFVGILKLLAIGSMTTAVDQTVANLLHLMSEGLPLLGMDYYVRMPFICATFFALATKLLDMTFGEAAILFLCVYVLPVIVGGYCLIMFGAMLFT